MTKIVFEPIGDLLKRIDKDFFEQPTFQGNTDYKFPYMTGVLQSAYKGVCTNVERQHNSELPRMKQGEDAIKLLYEICENTQRTGSGDFIIDKKYIRKIEELLRSE